MDKDLELILASRRGSDVAFSQICDKYGALLNSLSQKYSNMCIDEQGDKEDFLQESKIALYNAVLTYDVENQQFTFGAYAKACVRNRLVSYLRKCKSKKRQGNNFDTTIIEEKTVSDQVVWREFEQQLTEQADNVLSPLERRIFRMLISEMNVKEISEILNKSVKSVNNAIYRARKKLRKTLNEKIT